MLALVGSFLLKLLGNGILTPILAHLDQKAAANRDIAVAGIGADERRDIALVQGQIEANKLKSASQSAYPLIVYLIAFPPAVHAAAVYFDSLPFWTPWGAHVVGAWGVPTPPGIYQSMQQSILLSFFIVAPAVQTIKTVGSVVSAAVARR